VTKKTFLKLSSQIKYIKGIGPKRSQYFHKVGVHTVQDLLFFVPRRYIDYSTVLKIGDLNIDDEATIVGRIQLVERQKTRRRRHMLKVVIADNSGAIVIRWFNRPDLQDKFEIGDLLLVSGKVTFYQSRQLVNPLYEIIAEDKSTTRSAGNIIPVYPLTEGLNIWDVRRAIKIAAHECLDDIEETLPSSLIERNGLVPLKSGLQHLHFPESLEEAHCAKQRLIYDEFFFFELVLAIRKKNIKSQRGIQFKNTGILTREFLSLLPFVFTQGQKNVTHAIIEDMAKPRPMNRLLQGDVGSGKTVVALYAMLTAVENDYQAALMAPTEILAEQHYLVLSEYLDELKVSSALFTSSIKKQSRIDIVQAIKDGSLSIIFGTHALIEEEIEFDKLGLAVVDEQHRFGVMQRAGLVNKGVNPDFLVLSATPIPRTLALTLYGDLDVSILKEKPPSRGEIITKVVRGGNKHDVYEFVRQEINQGRQAYVICPIIEKSEKLSLRSVKEVFKEITQAFPDHNVAIIHGQLRTDERLRIMDEFRHGDIKILVATTVIEVGVDVKNATIMLIEHPERFGLAQLHQLRGRIGRGALKSFCFLFLDRYVASETYDRILFFSQHNDGFALAQKDISLRGPGEILGKRQHGLPDLRIGDLEKNKDLLFQARDDAFALVQHDPQLNMPEHSMVKKRLTQLTERAQLLRIG
jgi:ATP-dependent DNA helicase RecG